MLLPRTHIDGVDVGGITADQALTRLQALPQLETELHLQVDDIVVASSAAQLQLRRDVESSVATAAERAQNSSGLKRLGYLMGILPAPAKLHSAVLLEEAALTSQVEALKQHVDIEGATPSATLGTSGVVGSLIIDAGRPGRVVDAAQTLEQAKQSLQSPDLTPVLEITALVSSTSAVLEESQVAPSKERAAKFVGKRLAFRTDRSVLELNDQDLVKTLALPAGFLDAKVAQWLDQLTERVNRPGRDAEFEYDAATLKVVKFQPPLDGYTLDTEKAREAFSLSLQKLETETELMADVQVPITTAPPTKTLAGTNTLGIQERVGFGESNYRGSIPTRIHNVSLAASRINNFILPPGKEFSFNDAVGDVSAATGFQAAYVIKGGRTELGDGGGVCQVSTTLFRSVLNAGLNVTRRVPHSYRVGYYEQGFKPGIDATVYSGNVDLRFINDTSGHILIHTVVDSPRQYMTVEIFGTSDGRHGEIVNHRTWDFAPPPPAEYYPDASLAPGRVKQIDWSASGIKAEFTNVIKDKDGNVIREDKYFSNYRPWSAKYLRGG
jgi:vancomycin resistance protein YoaR